MTVSIIAGRGGTGKTSQISTIAQFLENYKWALMEIKDIKSLKHMATDILVSMNDNYTIDPIKTLNNFEQWKNKIITSDLSCVVVDGISDLRKYAEEEWIINNNEHRIAEGLKPRKSIGGENIGAWSDINNRVKGLLVPLINYGIANDIHVFFTAEMKDIYRNNKVVAIEPNIKPWIEYPCECIVILKSDGNKFWCDSTKVPAWSTGVFSETLEKNVGLMRVMVQYELLYQKIT